MAFALALFALGDVIVRNVDARDRADTLIVLFDDGVVICDKRNDSDCHRTHCYPRACSQGVLAKISECVFW